MKAKYEVDQTLAGDERIKARKRARYLANRETLVRKSREYRLVNKGKISESRRAKYEENKDVIKELGKKWRTNNRDRAKATSAEYRSKNPDAVRESKNRYYQNNKDKIAAYREQNRSRINDRWNKRYAKNPEVYIAKEAMRRARVMHASPRFDVELTKFVSVEAARLARLRKEKTGIAWHVDHVIPLRGRTVSGLHVWNNLAVIPGKLNLIKGNRYV